MIIKLTIATAGTADRGRSRRILIAWLTAESSLNGLIALSRYAVPRGAVCSPACTRTTIAIITTIPIRRTTMKSILSALARAGYRCFYFGKWHAGAGSALDFDCEGYSLEDYGNPYITAEYRDYLRRKNLPPAEHLGGIRL